MQENKRDEMIDMSPKSPLSESEEESEATNEEHSMTARIDIEHLLAIMPNKRYAYVVLSHLADYLLVALVAENGRKAALCCCITKWAASEVVGRAAL